MNTRHTLAALVVAFAAVGAAQAQEATVFPTAATGVSSLSRAEVAAEAARFVASGKAHEAAYLAGDTATPGRLDRAEVRAAAVRAVASGEARLLNSEGWTLARTAS